MTSAYYLRYGVWNAPSSCAENVDLSAQTSVLVSPPCRVTHADHGSIATDCDTDALISTLREKHGKNALFPDSGVCKATSGEYTVLNYRFEPQENKTLAPGSSVRVKYIPVSRKLASNEVRCDLNVLDILLLEQ